MIHKDILQAIKSAKTVLARRARLAHAYSHVWDSPEGKLVFNDLLSKAGLLTDLTAPATDDERSYAAGGRSIGIHILERMRWSEGELVRLSRQQTSDALEAMSEEGESL